MKNSSNNEHEKHEPMELELAVVRGETSGIIKAMGKELVLAEDTSYEQWCIVLKFIQETRKKASIFVADCLSFGVRKFGRKKVDDALEQLELEAELVKSGFTISAVPMELRFDNLVGDHYVELAKAEISKAKKIYWARIASEQCLTAVQLRFSIIEGEVVDRAAAKGMQTGVWTVQGIRQSFDVWVRRIGGIEGVKSKPLEEQVEIMEELDAICEFGMLLHEHLQKVHESTGQATA